MVRNKGKNDGKKPKVNKTVRNEGRVRNEGKQDGKKLKAIRRRSRCCSTYDSLSSVQLFATGSRDSRLMRGYLRKAQNSRHQPSRCVMSSCTINEDSFIPAIYIAPLQVHYHSEALPEQHGYCAGVSRQSATGNCRLRTCPRLLRGG